MAQWRPVAVTIQNVEMKFPPWIDSAIVNPALHAKQFSHGDTIAVRNMIRNGSGQVIRYHQIRVQKAVPQQFCRCDSNEHFGDAANSELSIRSHRGFSLHIGHTNCSKEIGFGRLHEQDCAWHSVLMRPFENGLLSARLLWWKRHESGSTSTRKKKQAGNRQ